ncbi:MAG: hypothetical protein E6G41_18145, partial [Actinobacteria bacterium]
MQAELVALTLRRLGRRLQARDRKPLAGRRHVGRAAVRSELGELLALRATRLAGAEVRVDLRAHRLDKLDRHLEGRPALHVLECRVVEVLGPHARDQVAAAHALRCVAQPPLQGEVCERKLEVVALDLRREEVHRRRADEARDEDV